MWRLESVLGCALVMKAVPTLLRPTVSCNVCDAGALIVLSMNHFQLCVWCVFSDLKSCLSVWLQARALSKLTSLATDPNQLWATP